MKLSEVAMQSNASSRLAFNTLTLGSLASALSAVALAWHGRRETGSAAAPVNAVSHWVWGDEAIHRDAPDTGHTALGAAIHSASSMLWAGVYAWLRQGRRQPTLANAASDAAAVTALAAFVDLKLTPHRFTPGFERRLSTPRLTQVYVAFGLGLLAGEVLRLRR